MEYAFFYISIAVVLLLLFISGFFRKIRFSNVLIGLLGAGYSMFFDVIFGGYLHLYYYISPQLSLFYMTVSAALIYPPLEMIYTLFLPESTGLELLYTICWIVLMLLFEAASLFTKTVVFTGWKAFPWSVVLYIITFLWINLLYRYMQKRGL